MKLLYYIINKISKVMVFIFIGLWPTAEELRKHPYLRQLVYEFFSGINQDLQLYQDIIDNVRWLREDIKKKSEADQSK